MKISPVFIPVTVRKPNYQDVCLLLPHGAHAGHPGLRLVRRGHGPAGRPNLVEDHRGLPGVAALFRNRRARPHAQDRHESGGATRRKGFLKDWTANASFAQRWVGYISYIKFLCGIV